MFKMTALAFAAGPAGAATARAPCVHSTGYAVSGYDVVSAAPVTQ
jgi:hypothetical protein